MSLPANKIGLFITLPVAVMIHSACNFIKPLKAPTRIGATSASLIIPESIILERSADGSEVNVAFETRAAVDCKFGFYALNSAKKSAGTFTMCAGKSATKFSEAISGVPKDSLVVVVLKSWPSQGAESSASMTTITESLPKADDGAINAIFVDLGARRLELTTIANSGIPSEVMRSVTASAAGCWLSGTKPTGFSSTRSALVLQSATSRGFINASPSRVSTTTFAGTFMSTQRQSSEWSLSAKTPLGFGQLRLAKPVLLSTAIFAGQDQSQGLDDSLDDIDPPALKLIATSSFVTTWTYDGDGKNTLATLTVEPSPGFAGITCVGPASAGKITVPAELVAKIPTKIRLWSTLRLDSWQALDKERWLVRVSDWKSMGIQRL